MPQLVEPVGYVGRPVQAFRWSWADQELVDSTQPCTLVLLDEGLAEIHRESVPGGELQVAGRLAEILAEGSQFHWFVEVAYEIHEKTVVSTPAAFGFLP